MRRQRICLCCLTIKLTSPVALLYSLSFASFSGRFGDLAILRVSTAKRSFYSHGTLRDCAYVATRSTEGNAFAYQNSCPFFLTLTVKFRFIVYLNECFV